MRTYLKAGLGIVAALGIVFALQPSTPKPDAVPAGPAFVDKMANGLSFIGEAMAQVPSIPPPYNVELTQTGVPAVIVNTARVASTLNGPQEDNLAYGGVVCTLNSTANSGSPSTTFKIQGFDAASASYYDLGTSGAMTATGAPTSLMVYPGIVATSLPTGMTVVGLHVPRKWRVQQIIAGTAGPAITGTLGCNLLK